MLKTLIATAFMLTFLVSQASAQSASLQGIVTDQNGAVVPNATVTATAENAVEINLG